MLSTTDTIENLTDLRKGFVDRLTYRAFSGGDDGEDEEETEDGEESGTGNGGDGSGSSGTDTGESDKDDSRDPEAHARSRAEAKYRVERNEARQRAEAAEKRLRELEDKGKEKAEVLERDLKEMTARAEAAEERALNATRQLTFVTSGAAALTNDPEVLLKLIKLDDLEPDDDGVIDSKEVLSRTEAILKAKPHLKASASGDDGDGSGKTQSGHTNNGRKGDKGDLDRKKLEGKFPALARR